VTIKLLKSTLGRLDSSCQSKPHNSLSKLLFSPDWTIISPVYALLAGLLACTIKPLQLIQNAAARVVFNEPKKAHVTPLFIRLHWLAACIKFKVLMCAYKTTTGAAPIYLNSLVQTNAPSRSLHSASERRLVVPSQKGTKSLPLTFSWTVPSWWNDILISIRVFNHF